jgi:transketolase
MELNKENVDILLMRNWFVDDNDILDLLDWLDQDIYDYVYENRSKYSSKVRYYIEPLDFKILTKFKLKELTDFDLFKEEKERNEQKEKLWQKYVSENNIIRPSNEKDFSYELKQKEIILKQTELQKLKSEYCSLRNREKREKEIEKIEDKIIDLKNELKSLFSEIKIEDEKYLKSLKNKWLTS